MTQRILFARSKTGIGRLLEPKISITTPAFGTRVPEHAFCVLRFDRASEDSEGTADRDTAFSVCRICIIQIIVSMNVFVY